MSKQHRTQMIKSLKEAMEKTKDPEMLLKLSQQAEKLMPKPGKETRGRKPTSVDSLPDGKRITHHLVMMIEAKCKGRGGWLKLSRPEKDALLAEAKKSLSKEECAAIEAFGAGSPEV